MANTQINITENGTKTLATAGKYCDRNIDVNVNVPILDTSDATATEADIAYGETAYVNGEKKIGTMRHKEYTGEIVSTVKGSEAIGSDVWAVLAKDDFLAEHRNDPTLWVRVEFDIEPTPYTIVKNWAFNTASGEIIPISSGSNFQYTYRWDANAAKSLATVLKPLNTDSPESVGCLRIMEDGELRCYSHSWNYAIRPSKYRVEVGW